MKRSPIDRVRDYLSLVRFSHTVFALPLAALAAAMGWFVAPFRPSHLIGFLVCMVAARTAAMAFNRLIDADIDAANARTADRHIPSGKLSKSEVMGLTIGSAIVFLLGTLLFLPNRWPLLLGLPVLAILLGYSLAKRFTPLCHYWLGFALGLSPISAYVAVTGTFDSAPILLGLAMTFWVGGFDVLYACQDEAFDRTAGLRSIPAAFGTERAFQIARSSHAVTVALLVAFGLAGSFGWAYYAGLIVIAGILLYEHLIVSPDDLRRVGIAFFNMNAIVSFGIFAVGVADRLLISG